MTIEEAIAMLRKNYERAKTLKYVYNPLGWALYRTWRYYDKKEKEAREKRFEQLRKTDE